MIEAIGWAALLVATPLLFIALNCAVDKFVAWITRRG